MRHFARAGIPGGIALCEIVKEKERAGGDIRAGSAIIQMLSLNSQSQMV